MKIKENAKMKGTYRFTKAKLETPKQFELNRVIQQKIQAGRNPIDLIRKLNEICKTEVLIKHNIIPTVGRAMIANNLTNATPTNTMLINKAELGTGTTAPANTDTSLETPVYRNDVASETNQDNIGYVTAFFGATEITGTFTEAGVYSNGTTTLGDGVLVSRVAVSIVKSNTETLTIDYSLTLN